MVPVPPLLAAADAGPRLGADPLGQLLEAPARLGPAAQAYHHGQVDPADHRDPARLAEGQGHVVGRPTVDVGEDQEAVVALQVQPIDGGQELVPRPLEAVLPVEAQGGDAASLDPERPKPAVPIKKSIQPDYIVCLEDGKQLKMLKRHLKTAYDMTPEEYRERWNLPSDYPMVAPNYAKRRSQLAKQIGLGTSGRGQGGGRNE